MKFQNKIVNMRIMSFLLLLALAACSSSGSGGDVEPDIESGATSAGNVEKANGEGTVEQSDISETAVPSTLPSRPESSELQGTHWVLTTFGPNDNQTAVLPDTELTLNFDGEQINGSAGCNSYFADVNLEADGKLSVGLVGSTLMACLDENVTQQESDFLAALAQVTSYTLSGNRLTLHSDSGSLQFVAATMQ